MTFGNLTRILDTHSVLLSREIAKLEDVYSLVDLVEEKLRLNISLTLLLLERDNEEQLVKIPSLDIKGEIKEALDDVEELKENTEPDVQYDESDENADDPNFEPEYGETSPKTETKAITIKIRKQKVIKDSTGDCLCNECGKIFGNKLKLKRHKRTMHESKGGCLCNECGKMYKNSRDLKRHRKAIHMKIRETYTCPICKKEGTYKYYSDFFKHKQRCEADLPENAERYPCTICGEKFGTYYNWKNHHYVCSGEKPKRSLNSKPTIYECHFENCDYKNRMKIRLKNHINTVHLNLPEIRNYFCDTCGKSFKDSRQLKIHVKALHIQARDHICTTCGNSFKTRGTLMKHREIHSDIYSYICPFAPCEKKFKQSATLYRHKLSCQFNPNKNKKNIS